MLARSLFAFIAMVVPALATASPRIPGGAGQHPLLVAIQPLGAVDPALVRRVTKHVESMFRVRVTVLRARALPRSAYYRPRSRYRGERILADLDARTPPHVSKVLGLMSRDLSVTKHDVYDWGILGVAGLSCRAAVVSTYRLQRRGATRTLVEERLDHVAVHELGHTFGVSHCASPRCVMNDAGGSIRTVDRTSGSFCASCRRRMGSVLRD